MSQGNQPFVPEIQKASTAKGEACGAENRSAMDDDDDDEQQ